MWNRHHVAHRGPGDPDWTPLGLHPSPVPVPDVHIHRGLVGALFVELNGRVFLFRQEGSAFRSWIPVTVEAGDPGGSGS